ncbi:hypothetical protein GCM10020256_32260 [Streptomyces thermocoprophilus]
MDDRVGAGLGEDAADGRLPDVGPYEVGAAEVVLGRHRVHRDHPVDLRISLDPPDEPAPSGRATPVTSTTFPKISAFLPDLVPGPATVRRPHPLPELRTDPRSPVRPT